MGFLKFLKRDKSKKHDMELENLDIPPLPPDIGEKLEDLPNLPDLPELPELEKPISEIEDKVLPELKPARDIPRPFPKLREIKVPEPTLEKPILGMESGKTMPTMEKFESEVDLPDIKPYESYPKASFREKSDVMPRKIDRGPIFMRADKFKRILNEIIIIKDKLKTADASLLELNDINSQENTEFEKWHYIIGDLQKRIISIDKNLFKGDKK